MRKSTWKSKSTLASALALVAASALAGQITLYERPAFRGQSMATTAALSNLEQSPFNAVASSLVVSDGTWEACTEAYFRGRCAQLVPGTYSKINADLSGPVASVRQVDYQPSPVRVVVNPDATMIGNSVAAPVVIGAAPAVVVLNPDPRQVLVAAPVVSGVPIPSGTRVTLYHHKGHLIRAVDLTSSTDDLDKRNFGGIADAAMVSGGIWRLCDGERGRGSCADYPPGNYDSLGALTGKVKSAYVVAPVQEPVAAVVAVPPGRAVLYEYANFGGTPAVVEYGRAPDIDWTHFKNPASSVRIETGTWLVCSDIGYQGECRVLDPGEYPVLTGMGRGISSARQVWRPQYGTLDLRRQATR